MTTENGLVRYDGNSFLTFNSSTTNLEQCRFSEISGNIDRDSLYCYNYEKEKLVLINQRKIQIVNKKSPICNITRNGKRFFFHDGLPSNNTVNVHESYYIRLSDGNIFFIDAEGLELCDAKMRKLYKMAYKNNSVFNFFAIDDHLYYLKENGEYDCFSLRGKSSGRLDPALFKTHHKLYWNLTAKQVFLCSKNKIRLLTAQGNRLSALPVVEFRDFDKSNIISIYNDRKNQKLYLGSGTNGLCIVSFPTFKTIKRNALNTDVYYSTLPFSDSTIITPEGFIISPEKVMDSIPFIKSVLINERTTMAFNEPITIAKDNDENIWIVRTFNVLCYLKKSGYKKYVKYSFKQTIKALFKDQNNTIWISLNWDESHKAILYSIQNGEPKPAATLNSNITYIAQYNSNTLYLGGEKGLFKYEIDSGKLFFIKNTEKINIRSIFIDSAKKIWLTTYEKGFFLYSDNVIHSFPKDKNNYLNSSHSIIEDKKGFFWIPTNKGLFQVARQALLKYSQNRTGTIYYHHYNKNDGFLTNEFNGGCQPCGNYLKNDYMAFPSMNGMVFFNPNKVTTLLPDKELFIDKVIMDHKVISPNDIIVLDNNFQRVRILIAYPYYGNSDNLNIEAKLEGATNSSWEKIGPDKSISFTTLPPGEYTLTIRSLSGFNADYVYKKITLHVPAMFYQTVWFNILCIVLAIALIIFLWYVRLYYIKLKNIQLKKTIAKKTKKLAATVSKLKLAKKNLKQEAEQQDRLVKSISHDIKSPLKFLTSCVHHLFDYSQIQDDIKLKRQVETIHTSSVQLYEYVENLIKYSTIFIEGKKLEDNSYSLHNLIEEKIQIFKKIAEADNTAIINSVDKSIDIRTNNKALSIIIHNLLDNAVKNTKNGSIELLCNVNGNILTLTIQDNGKGMSKELIDYYLDFYKNPIVKNYHLGLHMIIELLVILKGNINITSEVNEGTTIEIMVEYT
jgi:signal transduction histidine kinase